MLKFLDHLVTFRDLLMTFPELHNICLSTHLPKSFAGKYLLCLQNYNGCCGTGRARHQLGAIFGNWQIFLEVYFVNWWETQTLPSVVPGFVFWIDRNCWPENEDYNSNPQMTIEWKNWRWTYQQQEQRSTGLILLDPRQRYQFQEDLDPMGAVTEIDW